jgi:uncharacterized protein (TIGR02466 family)
MITAEFFPTLIHAVDIPNPVNFNKHLEKNILEWSRQDQGVQKTNVNGWHSPTDMASRPEYKPLVDELLKMQHEIYNKEHLDRAPVIGNMWANINPPGAYNKPHVHPNCLFSGVYYVKSQPNSGRLRIMDPRQGAQLYMPIRKQGEVPQQLWREGLFEPLGGRIIMFPAWLWHEVEVNNSNDTRISVSFNFIQGGFA